MTDQLPFSKEKQTKVVAPRCPRTGDLKRSCKCRPCIGSRNRRKGLTGQRVARKALGLRNERWSGRHANEEVWTAALRIEVKTGGNMANPVGLRYDQMRDQCDVSKAEGDPRPFVAVVKPDGWSDVIVMIRGQDLPDAVGALLEEWTDSEGVEVGG